MRRRRRRARPLRRARDAPLRETKRRHEDGAGKGVEGLYAARQPAREGMAPLRRRLAAEFVGTLLLVAVATGAATVLLAGPLERLTALPPTARQTAEDTELLTALLGNTAGDLLSVALAYGIALALLVYAFGGVSGGHFNPAVTFALAAGRRFPWGEVPLYAVVQLLGGIAGGFLVAGLYGEAGAEIGGFQVLFGATTVAPDVTLWNAILAEAFIAFVLMTAVMAVAVDPRAPKGWSGLVIGLALAAGVLVTGPVTGGSANLARSLGPLVASLPYSGVDSPPWQDLVVYLIGPLVGAACAALVYESVTALPPAAAPEPGAASARGEGEPVARAGRAPQEEGARAREETRSES